MKNNISKCLFSETKNTQELINLDRIRAADCIIKVHYKLKDYFSNDGIIYEIINNIKNEIKGKLIYEPTIDDSLKLEMVDVILSCEDMLGYIKFVQLIKIISDSNKKLELSYIEEDIILALSKKVRKEEKVVGLYLNFFYS